LKLETLNLRNAQEGKEKEEKTALIICRDGRNSGPPQKQFCSGPGRRDRENQDGPLTGEFLREYEELMVLVSHTVLNLAHPNHMREALLSRRIGLGGK